MLAQVKLHFAENIISIHSKSNVSKDQQFLKFVYTYWTKEFHTYVVHIIQTTCIF